MNFSHLPFETPLLGIRPPRRVKRRKHPNHATFSEHGSSKNVRTLPEGIRKRDVEDFFPRDKVHTFPFSAEENLIELKKSFFLSLFFSLSLFRAGVPELEISQGSLYSDKQAIALHILKRSGLRTSGLLLRTKAMAIRTSVQSEFFHAHANVCFGHLNQGPDACTASSGLETTESEIVCSLNMLIVHTRGRKTSEMQVQRCESSVTRTVTIQNFITQN